MKATRVQSIFLILAFLTLGAYLAFALGDDPPSSVHDHLHHQHFAEFARVPQKARARHNPLETDPDAIPAGRKLFAQHCAECHGSMAEGGRKAPNLHAEEVQNATPGTLFWILTNGVIRRGMPVWSKLPETERWQIITFLKSLTPSSGGAPAAVHDHTDQAPSLTSDKAVHPAMYDTRDARVHLRAYDPDPDVLWQYYFPASSALKSPFLPRSF